MQHLKVYLNLVLPFFIKKNQHKCWQAIKKVNNIVFTYYTYMYS